jgi:preprotein translocase subunit SecY
LFTTLGNAWKIPDLRKKIFYTLMMIVVFRLGSSIPVPGVDKTLLEQMVSNDQGLLGFFDLMSGGSFKRLSIFALGISPYITASIIMNLLQIAFPESVGAMVKEGGEEGRKKSVQYTRYGTIVLALIQGFGWSLTLFKPVFVNPNMGTYLLTTVILTAGTAFLMYLGEKITENGIGNGISLFIFAGIIAGVPGALIKTYKGLVDATLNPLSLVLFVVVAIAIIVGVIYIQEGVRKIPVQYAKRVVGRKTYGGHSSYVPIKVNQAGVIPIIFGVSLLMFPMTIAQFFPGSSFYLFLTKNFNSTGIVYNICYALLIVFFTYFYTSVIFNPSDFAENMKRNGGFIPGIRPGKPTSEYLQRVINRLTLSGAIFLALIAVVPNFILAVGSMGFQFGGTSLLIVVGVALETMKQIEAQMVMRHYQGFLK